MRMMIHGRKSEDPAPEPPVNPTPPPAKPSRVVASGPLCGVSAEERFKKFGIIGFAAPAESITVAEDALELPAIFKQHWSDFVVTEIPAVPHHNSGIDLASSSESSSPSAASMSEQRAFAAPVLRASSREDFAIPVFPTWLDSTARQRLLQDLVAAEQQQAEGGDAAAAAGAVDAIAAASDITSAESLFKPAEDVAAAAARRTARAERMYLDAVSELERQELACATHTTASARRNFSRASQRLRREFHLQCVLHKRHVSHVDALKMIGRALRLHPDSITTSGIKDFNGDTAQLVRLRGVAPSAAMRANFWIAQRVGVEWALRRAKEEKEQEFLRESMVDPASAVEKDGKAGADGGNGKKQGGIDMLLAQQRTAPSILLSHFSYERAALASGRLVGNHFKIVLRGVPASAAIDARLDRGADRLLRYGFPNFFGCQRFSWFGDSEHDPARALLHGDVLSFAFRLLGFTDGSHSLRALLQRRHMYPMQIQESFRREVVRELERMGLSPEKLEECQLAVERPELGTYVPYDADTLVQMGAFNKAQVYTTVQLVACLRRALAAVRGTGRRLICQALCSWLWNTALAERIRLFGLQRVLPGDLVVPGDVLQSSALPHRRTNSGASSSHSPSSSSSSLVDNETERQREFDTFVDHDQLKMMLSRQVTSCPEDIRRSSIFEVCHPRFNFHGEPLRDKCGPEVEAIMHRVCRDNNLAWGTIWPRRLGLERDFLERPRPICAMPANFHWRRSPTYRDAIEVEFSLGKGAYANVCLRELLRAAECPGAEEVSLRPVPDAVWWQRGAVDPGALPMAAEDMYPTFKENGFDDGTGGVEEALPADEQRAEPPNIYEYSGPWSRPDERQRIQQFGAHVLLGNRERQEKYNVLRAKELFEPAIARKMSGREIMRYAGHSVPLQPNAPRKQITARVFRMKMKSERDPKRRRLLNALNRKTSREIEFKLASRNLTWSPQR